MQMQLQYRPKVLVVDDEVDISDFICAAAEKQGYQATALNDSTEFASTYLIDTSLIVLDLNMPGVDGIEVIRFLAANKSQASLVISSGSDKAILRSAEELAKAHGLDVIGVLKKPVRLAELKRLFARYAKPLPRPQHIPLGGSDEFPSVDDLREAIDSGGLSLACQPQINLQTGDLTGVEMLVRWQHSVKGAIPPYYFVPMAEKAHLIDELTAFVVSHSLRQAGAWRTEGIDTRVSINMSPLSLTDVELPEKISDLARQNRVDPARVVIEVTETALAQNMVQFLDVLTRLRLKGFKLSIDDFGTGYSSMGQLIRAPFNELKIDRTFVKDIRSARDSRVIIGSSIKMAHDLGITVVAEGIETAADWNFLHDLGCDDGQGYWMARPMPTRELGKWINTREGTR